ncbi:hypothetical protein DM01DRAFT_1335215 [Hesseltinella vesiculosa]|uniref:Invertebrate defensins family profile domain-containing protein n=1 Tax=Hesseltinella vesiculosa TaxID=101127 RepID=A0A1X2GIQ6_9FUNG|nr:hypothetical protein DM01DRAFT_1335215 [Hesseltinella vesiculosa]
MSYSKTVFLLVATVFALLMATQAEAQYLGPIAKRQNCDFGQACVGNCAEKCSGENVGRPLRSVCYQGSCYCGFTP